MIVQAVLLFLLLIVVLGVGGKWLRLPSRRRQPPIQSATRCPICRSYAVGRPPEPCARADCPYRRAA